MQAIWIIAGQFFVMWIVSKHIAIIILQNGLKIVHENVREIVNSQDFRIK